MALNIEDKKAIVAEVAEVLPVESHEDRGAYLRYLLYFLPYR